jgi:hypothetical protein
MAVNSLNALPKAKKTRWGVYSIHREFRIIVAVKQRWLALPIETRSIQAPYKNNAKIAGVQNVFKKANQGKSNGYQ